MNLLYLQIQHASTMNNDFIPFFPDLRYQADPHYHMFLCKYLSFFYAS